MLLFLANTFMMNFAQKEDFLSVPEDGGFLASYGFINNILRNLPVIFVTGPIASFDNVAELTIGDDSDGGFKKYVGQDFYFYADYNYVGSGLPVSTGFCRIKFEDYLGVYSSFENMIYDGSTRFEYVKIGGFNYKGSYDFEIECSEDGGFIEGVSPGFVRVNEQYIISNTAPNFMTEAVTTNYIGVEDTTLYHNFSNNFTDPDINDEWTFLINTINDGIPNNYQWIFLNETNNNILIINVTKDNEAEPFDISMRIFDTQTEGSSRVFTFIIDPRNDAPIFINLDEQTLNVNEPFDYLIIVDDEENDSPFKFNISFNCDAATLAARGNCTLFSEEGYSVDKQTGELSIDFTPLISDVGIYFINFSVEDSNVLGNKTTSEVVKFEVRVPLWNNSFSYDYSLVEDELYADFPLDLNLMIINEIGQVTFSNKTAFPSFDLTSDGIINFIPGDIDVGNYEVEIIATDSIRDSSKIFNFTTENVNDAPSIALINAEGHISIDGNYNIEAYENANVKIFLFIQDDDFLIPLDQKSFYDENLEVDLTITGPNTTLFDFVLGSVNKNQAKYDAWFIPREDDVGKYEIEIDITDNSGVSEISSFNLTILERAYDLPEILYPDVSNEFNLYENISSTLIFRGNHSVRDNLTYRFYVGGVLKHELSYYGDGRDLNWDFVPNFSDETYGEVRNLTLVVLNPYFSDLNVSRTWNLTINHTNSPVEFIRDIGDKKGISLDYSLMVDLKDHFLDIDHEDVYYNQSVEFNIVGDKDIILVSGVSSDWIFSFSSSAPVSELFNITAYDLNMTDSSLSLTNSTSNDFTVEFVPPTKVPTPVPVSRTRHVPLSIKIIMPGQISAYSGEKMEIPLTLINSGSRSFTGLELNSSALKHDEEIKEIITSLDKTSFKSLESGDEENLTLSVFFDTDKLGDYEILVNVVSKSPSYKDWGKIHVNLQAINESKAKELILFTQEFIAQNPQCIEINEVVNEAQKYFEAGDYVSAREKTEQAINACEESISQVSLPRLRIEDFKSWYLVLAIVLAFVIGLLYYLFKRRRLQNLRNVVPSTSLLGQHKKV